MSVLYVEDEAAIREQVKMLLSQLFESVTTASDGLEALGIYVQDPRAYDIVVTDIMMPKLNGIELVRKIKEINVDQAVLVVSAYGDSSYLLESIWLGVDGYIVKPISADQFYPLFKKVATAVSNKKELERYHNSLEALVQERTLQLEELNIEIATTLEEVVVTLGGIAESRSKETGAHTRRVAEYSKLLALAAGLGEEESQLLHKVSPLHDVGKIAISDAVLNKPSALEPHEFEQMKTHTTIGFEMLKGSSKELFAAGAIVAHEHHERWDGNGYPRGLQGEQIHIYGRITAIADVFDALSMKRCYKDAWPEEKIFEYMKEVSGKQFDPRLCELFFDRYDEMLQIKKRFGDDPEPKCAL